MGLMGYAKDVLVSTGWVAEHCSDGNVVVAEVDEDPTCTRRATSPAPSSSTGRTTCRIRSSATSSTRPRSSACSARAGSATTRPSSSTATQQLVRRLRVLVPEGLRARRRADPRRRAPEVDRRAPRADQRGAERRRGAYTAQDRDETIRAYRDHVRDLIGDGGDVARRRALPAGVRRRAARAARLRVGGRLARRPHPRPRESIPWAPGGATTTAPSRAPTHCAISTPARGSHRTRRRRLLPYRRALGAHLVRAPGAARLPERPQLRRLVDRVGQPRRRADREGPGRVWPPSPGALRPSGRPVEAGRAARQRAITSRRKEMRR